MRQLYIPSRENRTVNKFGQFSNEPGQMVYLRGRAVSDHVST